MLNSFGNKWRYIEDEYINKHWQHLQLDIEQENNTKQIKIIKIGSAYKQQTVIPWFFATF